MQDFGQSYSLTLLIISHSALQDIAVIQQCQNYIELYTSGIMTKFSSEQSVPSDN